MLCAIWYYLHSFKNVKNTHGRVLLLVKLQAEAYNFTKSNTTPWMFFTFSKLYMWYQIVQSITHKDHDRNFTLLTTRVCRSPTTSSNKYSKFYHHIPLNASPIL